MEIPEGERKVPQMCFRECIGTAALVFSLNASGGNAAAVAGALFGSIMILAGRFNGGHFNPAVTLAVLTREGLENFGHNFGLSLMLIFNQMIGAAIGFYAATYLQVEN